MKKSQINGMLKKGKLSPFMVAKLIFNDKWREGNLQEPVFSHTEKQALVDKISYDDYHQYKQWKEWFIDIDTIYNQVKEFYLLAEKDLFQLLWLIEKDVTKGELRAYFKNMYPQPVTVTQYQDLRTKDREDKLDGKYSITMCLIELIEDKLPGAEKGLTLEDYICDENDNRVKDRKLIAEHFKTAVKTLLSFIDHGKIKPTRVKQLLPLLKASLKKTPGQIADILLAGIYSDVDPPVNIFESSTVSGKQLYKHFKEWVEYVDTFYSDTGGGYAIVQETSHLFLDKNGYFKPLNTVENLLGGESKSLFKTNGTLDVKLNTIGVNFYFFQFNRMIIDVLSDKLSIPLNGGNEKIGLQSLKAQAEYLEICRTMLFDNLARISYSDKKLADLISEYETKTVAQYYPSPKVVEFCKNYISSMSEYKHDWFYDIKDFYMKEVRIKTMTADEIKHLKSIGNKKQAEHFRGLVEASTTQ